jgi:quinol monooxygenase YgiN
MATTLAARTYRRGLLPSEEVIFWLDMVVLTAYLRVKPELMEEALDACRTARTASRTEPGCEVYDFFVSPDDPATIVFVEEWTTKADLDTHFQAESFKNFGAAMSGVLTQEPDIRIFESTRYS